MRRILSWFVVALLAAGGILLFVISWTSKTGILALLFALVAAAWQTAALRVGRQADRTSTLRIINTSALVVETTILALVGAWSAGMWLHLLLVCAEWAVLAEWLLWLTPSSNGLSAARYTRRQVAGLISLTLVGSTATVAALLLSERAKAPYLLVLLLGLIVIALLVVFMRRAASVRIRSARPDRPLH